MSKTGPPGNKMRLKSAGGWADPSDFNEPMHEIEARFNEHDHVLCGVNDEDLVDDRRVKTVDESGAWAIVRGTATPGHTSGAGSSLMFRDGPEGDPGFIAAPKVGVLVTTEDGEDPLLVAVRGVGVASFSYVVFVDNGTVGESLPSDCVVHWSAMGRVSGG